MTRLVFWIRACAGVLGFSAAVVWLIVLRVLRWPNDRCREAFARTMSALTCPAIGLRLEVTGREFVEQTAPSIYVANHQSYIDYPVCGALFPGNAVVLARQVGKLPVLGTLFRRTGNISVERDVPVRAAEALQEAEDAIVKQRLSVWIFAEGTRGKVSGQLGPFKRGAFRLALTTGAPIVPVVVEPLKPDTDVRARRLTSRTLQVRVLEPLFAKAGESEDELGARVRALMQETLNSLATPAARERAR